MNTDNSYRKKPVVIQAFKLGTDPMPDWFMDAVSANTAIIFNEDERHRGGPDHAIIKTLEGDHRADFGDFIIQGVKGELYPCKPDIFEVTYEPAGRPESSRGSVAFRRKDAADIARDVASYLDSWQGKNFERIVDEMTDVIAKYSPAASPTDRAAEARELGLKWGRHDARGEWHIEWHAPCGCAYHPDPKPHVHPCIKHSEIDPCPEK